VVAILDFVRCCQKIDELQTSRDETGCKIKLI